MIKQIPYITLVSLTGAASQQWTDPNATVPTTPSAPNPQVQPGASPEPVQAQGVRVVPKAFQEILFKAPVANAAVAYLGVMIAGAINWLPMEAGTSRGWTKLDLNNVPVDLTDFYFKGSNGDKIYISGLPDRGHR